MIARGADTASYDARVRTTLLIAVLAPALSIAARGAHAQDFRVSGTIAINGVGSALSDGTFGPSAYDNTSGTIAAGAFDVPSAVLQFGPGGDNQVTVHYQLVQTNTASGQVASDGVAAMTDATMKLHVIDAHTPAVLWDVGGTCDFEPIDVGVLGGTGAASGLDLGASGFTIPPVDAGACGGHGSQLDAGLAGNQTSLQLQLAGDFTPPVASDKIFADGFEPGG